MQDLLTPDERVSVEAARARLEAFSFEEEELQAPVPKRADGHTLAALIDAVRVRVYFQRGQSARCMAARAAAISVQLLYSRGAGERARDFCEDLDRELLRQEVLRMGRMSRESREVDLSRTVDVLARGGDIEVHDRMRRWFLVRLKADDAHPSEQEAVVVFDDLTWSVSVLCAPSGLLLPMLASDPLNAALASHIVAALRMQRVMRAVFRQLPERAPVLLGAYRLLVPPDALARCDYCGGGKRKATGLVWCTYCKEAVVAAGKGRVPKPAMIIAEVARALRAEGDPDTDAVVGDLEQRIARAERRTKCPLCECRSPFLATAYGALCRECVLPVPPSPACEGGVAHAH